MTGRLIECVAGVEARRRLAKADRYRLALPLLRELRAEACAEYRFHHVRLWRFDFALPADRIGIEIDGGAFSGGRHSRGAGFREDCIKLNAAAVLGWRILRFLPEHLTTKRMPADFIAVVRAALEHCP